MADTKIPALPATPSGTQTAKPVAPVVAAAGAPPQNNPVPAKPSVAAFGGLRGGRKRADGLVPGSPEAHEADKAKDAERKRLARLREAEQNPVPLPSAPVGPGVVVGGAVAPVVDGASPVPAPVAGLVVPWSVRILAKPARLVTRIIDRMRQLKLLRKLDKLVLPEPVKREIKADIQWSDAAINDFSDALAECTAIELNKAQISSAQQHWINLGITAGELTLAHFSLSKRLDELILAQQTTRKTDPNNQRPEQAEPKKEA